MNLPHKTQGAVGKADGAEKHDRRTRKQQTSPRSRLSGGAAVHDSETNLTHQRLHRCMCTCIRNLSLLKEAATRFRGRYKIHVPSMRFGSCLLHYMRNSDLQKPASGRRG